MTCHLKRTPTSCSSALVVFGRNATSCRRAALVTHVVLAVLGASPERGHGTDAGAAHVAGPLVLSQQSCTSDAS